MNEAPIATIYFLLLVKLLILMPAWYVSGLVLYKALYTTFTKAMALRHRIAIVSGAIVYLATTIIFSWKFL